MNILQMFLIVVIAFIAGVGSVTDEWQTHRPIVACTLIGLVLGDLTTGIILGGTLELIALGWMNIGAAMAPDSALASVVSSILVINSGVSIEEGLAVAIPLAAAGQALTIFVRTIVVAFVHKADSYAEEGNTRGVAAMHIVGMATQGLRIAIPTVIVLMVSPTTVSNVLNSIPDIVTSGLQVAGGFIVVVGYAMVINMMISKSLVPFLFLGFIFAAVGDFNLIHLGGIGLITAIIYIALKSRNASSDNSSLNDDFDSFDADLEDI